jgi:Zn finger protein HypA/HybF involved in hydrogenase expression
MVPFNIHSVDWLAIGKATNSIPKPTKIKFAKLMFDFNQTNYLNNKYYNTTATCPCCNKATETHNHVLICPSPQSISARLLSREAFRSALEKQSTPSSLIELALILLSDKNDLPTNSADLQDLYNSQLKIGWDQFLCGRISTKWGTTYNRLTGSKQKLKPLTWTVRFIKAIWQYSHSLWKHRSHVAHNQINIKNISVSLSKLHDKTTKFFSQFSNDPHMIPEYLRYLFDNPLETMYKLSEDAIRCWVATIEESCSIQQSLHRASTGSVQCMYRFLGKSPPASLITSLPNKTEPINLSNDQKDSPSGTVIVNHKQQKQKRQRRSKSISKPRNNQVTLTKFGFRLGVGRCISPSRNHEDADSKKKDFSGMLSSTTP